MAAWRLIFVAYAVDPELGSEPGVGWNFLISALKQAHRSDGFVDLLCSQTSGAAVREHVNLLGCWADRLAVHSLSSERIERSLLGTPMLRIHYILWIREVRRYLSKVEAADERLYIHHVTFGSEILPVGLPKLRRQSFRVWGPVGSTGDPRIYDIHPRSMRHRAAALAQILRNAIADRVAGRNARRADLVLTQSDAVARRLQRRSITCYSFPNFVPSEDIVRAIAERRTTRQYRRGSASLLVVGQLTLNKRVDLAVSLLAEPELQTAQLIVAGSGPEAARLKRLAYALGVSDRVSWTGEVERLQVVELMRTSDVLLHLSAREGASGAVAEATMLGLPVVCFSTSGAAETLEYSEGPGIALSPRCSIARISLAVLEAIELTGRSEIWTIDRLDDLTRRLYGSSECIRSGREADVR